MTVQDYISLISITSGVVLTAVALLYTRQSHKRENTINNENFIYQKKYDTCEKLFSLGVEYINAAENVREWLKIMQKKKTEFNEEEFDKKEEEFDKIEEQFEIEFMKAAIILPEKIMDAFGDLVYTMNTWEETENLEAWKKNIDVYYKQLDKVHSLVVKDLHLKVLNDGISVRINKDKKEIV